MSDSTLVVSRDPSSVCGGSAAGAGERADTRAARRDSVERSIRMMHERLAEPLAHEEMAQAALLSQYHFNRVFRQITGISPRRFLTVVRMAEAKRLLLETPMRVTDVCLSVGFESLGTFTTRFGQFVGLGPRQLRSLIRIHGDSELQGIVREGRPREGGQITGWLETPPGIDCFALVGLFSSPLPQSLPIACGALWAPGPFELGRPRPDVYSLLAVGFPPARTVRDAMVATQSELLVSSSERPIHVREGNVCKPLGSSLRWQSAIDPPVVMAAPILAASAQREM